MTAIDAPAAFPAVGENRPGQTPTRMSPTRSASRPTWRCAVLKKAGIIVAVAATGVLGVSSLAFAGDEMGNLSNDCAFENESGEVTQVLEGATAWPGPSRASSSAWPAASRRRPTRATAPT